MLTVKDQETKCLGHGGPPAQKKEPTLVLSNKSENSRDSSLPYDPASCALHLPEDRETAGEVGSQHGKDAARWEGQHDRPMLQSYVTAINRQELSVSECLHAAANHERGVEDRNMVPRHEVHIDGLAALIAAEILRPKYTFLWTRDPVAGLSITESHKAASITCASYAVRQ